MEKKSLDLVRRGRICWGETTHNGGGQEKNAQPGKKKRTCRGATDDINVSPNQKKGIHRATRKIGKSERKKGGLSLPTRRDHRRRNNGPGPPRGVAGGGPPRGV